jgi:hypothetical protein
MMCVGPEWEGHDRGCDSYHGEFKVIDVGDNPKDEVHLVCIGLSGRARYLALTPR